mmetsp:Transcript_52947/g.99219  ORF Transcript_52947/g.99219 Transcript_52947/m.99219 type:complete len:209 (+) Transcript_52947:44-670(+)
MAYQIFAVCKQPCQRIRTLKAAILLGFVWHHFWLASFVNVQSPRARGTASRLQRAADLRATLPPGAILDAVPAAGPDTPSAQIVLTLLCAVLPMAYWWYVIVPFKRREVASSKRRGEIKGYLDDLAKTPADERKPEKWLYDKYLREANLLERNEVVGLPKVVQTVEDELQQLPGGGFWSFDNPVFIGIVMLVIFILQQLLVHSLQVGI